MAIGHKCIPKSNPETSRLCLSLRYGELSQGKSPVTQRIGVLDILNRTNPPQPSQYSRLLSALQDGRVGIKLIVVKLSGPQTQVQPGIL